LLSSFQHKDFSSDIINADKCQLLHLSHAYRKPIRSAGHIPLLVDCKAPLKQHCCVTASVINCRCYCYYY